MKDLDWCYECSGYGDDYYIDQYGELQCTCDICPNNMVDDEEEDE